MKSTIKNLEAIEARTVPALLALPTANEQGLPPHNPKLRVSPHKPEFGISLLSGGRVLQSNYMSYIIRDQ